MTEQSPRERALAAVRERPDTLIERMQESIEGRIATLRERLPTRAEAVYWMKTTGKEKLKEHLVDTTTLSAIASPIFTLMDASIGLISGKEWHEASYKARLIGTASGMIGTVFLYENARKRLRAYFDIDDNHHHAPLHDFIYAYPANVILSAGLYALSSIASGEFDIAKIGASAGIGGVAGMVAGYFAGTRMTILRHLWLGEETSKLPQHVKEYSPLKKRLIGATAVATLAALTCSMYLLPERHTAVDARPAHYEANAEASR
jgi:hypothetical protein